MNDLLAENHFSILLPRKNANFFSYALSQKPRYGEKMDKRQFLNEGFWKESKLAFSRFFGKLVSGTNLSGEKKSSNRKLWKKSDSEVKLTCKKNRFWWMFCLQKISLRSFYHSKTPTSAVICFSKSIIWKKWKKNSFWMKAFEKNQSLRFPAFLECLFLRATILEKKHSLNRKLWKKIRFWISFLITRQTFKQVIYFVWKFELKTHIASELESRCLQRISFR